MAGSIVKKRSSAVGTRTSAPVERWGPMLGMLAIAIHRYGAFGVALGAGLEGEAAVVTGGVLASHGAFSPFAAAIGAWIGSFIVDQVFFTLGRSQRTGRFVTKVTKKAVFSRALAIVNRHPVAFCLAFRFVYGFRVAGPIAIGVSQVPARRFLVLNCASAALWAAIFTTLGYRFGPRLEQLVKTVFTPTVLLFVGGVAALTMGAFFLWRRRTLPRSNTVREL